MIDHDITTPGTAAPQRVPDLAEAHARRAQVVVETRLVESRLDRGEPQFDLARHRRRGDGFRVARTLP